MTTGYSVSINKLSTKQEISLLSLKIKLLLAASMIFSAIFSCFDVCLTCMDITVICTIAIPSHLPEHKKSNTLRIINNTAYHKGNGKTFLDC